MFRDLYCLSHCVHSPATLSSLSFSYANCQFRYILCVDSFRLHSYGRPAPHASICCSHVMLANAVHTIILSSITSFDLLLLPWYIFLPSLSLLAHFVLLSCVLLPSCGRSLRLLCLSILLPTPLIPSISPLLWPLPTCFHLPFCLLLLTLTTAQWSYCFFIPSWVLFLSLSLLPLPSILLRPLTAPLSSSSPPDFSLLYVFLRPLTAPASSSSRAC